VSIARHKRDLERSSPLATSESPIDPDLAAIIQRWPDLPEAIKAGIVALVRAVDEASTK
jgi:hypothetical protein